MSKAKVMRQTKIVKKRPYLRALISASLASLSLVSSSILLFASIFLSTPALVAFSSSALATFFCSIITHIQRTTFFLSSSVILLAFSSSTSATRRCSASTLLLSSSFCLL
ncbi:hypothetical protein BZA05DRAFT_408667 [Tricharina praecox]|uniref:uncharacterized protein n=1 Tax=Tricharina praecox TaxID=43433 RepID=UPI00221F2747|nr:uncharacterized protein BZA05DRAFT_408667 [Tricharina praecox]KAI5844845.1 hypothetical protein BZA05DRAFT_408667 [Tricharina praecox]